MDETTPRHVPVQRALQQRLESLSRAGIEQLPKWTGEVPELTPDAGTPTGLASPAPPVPEVQAPEVRVPEVRVPEVQAPEESDAQADASAPQANAPVATPSPKAIPEPKSDPSPAPAPPIDVAGDRPQTLTLLEQQVCQCERCPELVSNRTQTVFGVGNPRARLCFFGEGPGADEDRQGEPFVGAAGQLLNKIINACKMQREDVYILNTVKCRPPGNRNPSPDEVANCRPFFEQQLEIIRPEFICCLGSVAAQALLESTKSVGRLRGTLHSWRFAQVLVTYHPAYLLRNPSAKKMVWADMQYLMAQMGIDLK